jgi:N-formylglutamate amidohydrolase
MDLSLTHPFALQQPAGEPSPVVLSSPHSGRVYPRAVLDRLRVDAASLLALDDGPVDKLVQQGCAAGAVMIAARYPRAVVDLNREPDEIDPDLVSDPGDLRGMRVTARARAGLGVVPSRVGGVPLWRERLGAGDLAERLEAVFHPYHAEVEALLRERLERFGAALLLDCHSMPGLAADGGRPAVDVALGDRFGQSCAPELVAVAEAALRAAGLEVARNRPYAGGYITCRHGRPGEGLHALQVELRRGLFMDEATHVPHAGFAAVQEVVGALVADLGAAARRLGLPALTAAAGSPSLARAS